MTLKKKLENRIQGWLPKEPILSINYKNANISSFKPHPDDHRIVSYFGPPFIIGGLIAIIAVFSNVINSNVPFSLQMQWVAFGLVTGTAVGAVITLNQMSFLTLRGEINIALETILFLIGSLAALLVTIVALPHLLLSMQIEWENFIYSSVSAIVVSRIILLIAWEQTHKKRIFQNRWGTWLYAVAK